MSTALATGIGTPLSRNTHLLSWIETCVRLTKPERVVWCDGSAAEKDALTREAVRLGILIPLNQKKLPGCYLHRSNPNDVARTEQLTFICTRTKEEAGPTNNWMAPEEAYQKLRRLFDGSMTGRTLYVVPYVMGPIGSPMAKIGVELTDSLYVVLNMGIMTRMGQRALDALGSSNDFNRGLHWHARRESRPPVRLPFPGGQHRLVGRQRIRRQRPPRKEMPRPAHRLVSRPARGLDGRAHDDRRRRRSERRNDVRGGGVSERLRQDELRHADPAEALPRLEGLDGRRRHLLDATRPGRPALGHQPRGGLLRRRARDERGHEPHRDAHDQQGHDLHERGDDPGRRRVVGGQGRRGARRADRLAGPPVEEGLAGEGGAPEQPLHGAHDEQPAHVAARERSRGRAHRGHRLRRPPLHDGAPRRPGLQLGARRLHGRDARLGDDRRHHRQGGRRAPRPDGDAPVLRLRHGDVLRPLAGHAEVHQGPAEDFSR